MYSLENTLVFYDGSFLPSSGLGLDPFSQTFHYGYGVFEGMRAYQTPEGPRIFRAAEHLARLERSAGRLSLKLRFSAAEMEAACYELLRRSQLRDAYLRPVIFAAPNMSLSAPSESHLMILAWKWGKLLGSQPLRLMISSFERPNPRASWIESKICGHYVNSILANAEARNAGYQEALLLDEEGNLASASAANLFIEKNEALHTPALGQIFPGITRGVVMELAAELGIPVVERKISPEEIFDADSAFLTGTATEIVGVASVDGQALPLPWRESLGALIARKYHQLTTQGDAHRQTLI